MESWFDWTGNNNTNNDDTEPFLSDIPPVIEMNNIYDNEHAEQNIVIKLNATKKILSGAINSLAERGDKIEALEKKSDDLILSSREMYRSTISCQSWSRRLVLKCITCYPCFRIFNY